MREIDDVLRQRGFSRDKAGSWRRQREGRFLEVLSLEVDDHRAWYEAIVAVPVPEWDTSSVALADVQPESMPALERWVCKDGVVPKTWVDMSAWELPHEARDLQSRGLEHAISWLEDQSHPSRLVDTLKDEVEHGVQGRKAASQGFLGRLLGRSSYEGEREYPVLHRKILAAALFSMRLYKESGQWLRSWAATMDGWKHQPYYVGIAQQLSAGQSPTSRND